MSNEKTPTKIVGKITSCAIKKDTTHTNEKPVVKKEKKFAKRPEVLFGATYKIKPPFQEKALYLTINDTVLDDGVKAPYEVFLNSKDMSQFQWIISMTRLISAIFRQGEDPTFYINELKSVFDPNGGYWNKQRFFSSLVAEIGYTIEQHIKNANVHVCCGNCNTEIEEVPTKEIEVPIKEVSTIREIKGSLCPECGQYTLIKEGGCDKCFSCSYSKCG